MSRVIDGNLKKSNPSKSTHFLNEFSSPVFEPYATFTKWADSGFKILQTDKESTNTNKH